MRKSTLYGFHQIVLLAEHKLNYQYVPSNFLVLVRPYRPKKEVGHRYDVENYFVIKQLVQTLGNMSCRLIAGSNIVFVFPQIVKASPVHEVSKHTVDIKFRIQDKILNEWVDSKNCFGQILSKYGKGFMKTMVI